jgi:hypothetical protein
VSAPDHGTPAEKAGPPSDRQAAKGGSIASYVLLVVAGLLLLLSSFAVWVNRVALNTTVFTNTSTQLIQDPAIRQTVATRAVDDLYASVDVQAEIKKQLPACCKSLSGPAAAGLRQASYQIVERALGQPALQSLWAASVRTSHEALVQLLEGGGTTVSTSGGVVNLDLRQIVLEAADRIGIGEQVANKLPASAGQIEILRSNDLKTAQNGFQLLKTLAWLLPLLTLAAFGAAAWIVRGRRRRVVRDIGITVLVVGVLGLVAVNVVGNYVVNSLVADTESRQAAHDAWSIVSELLRSSYRWLVVIGILIVVGAWVVGPGRRALGTRSALAPVVRERLYPYVGLAIVGLVLFLSGSVSDFTRLLSVVTVILLGALWIEVVRRQTLQEFPDAGVPAFVGGTRDRVSSWWETRRAQSPKAGEAPAHDVTSRLEHLADLHTRGELTDDEYASAKARLLSGG